MFTEYLALFQAVVLDPGKDVGDEVSVDPVDDARIDISHLEKGSRLLQGFHIRPGTGPPDTNDGSKTSVVPMVLTT